MKYEYKRCNGAFRFSAVAAGGILTLALAACGGGSDTVTHEPTIGALTVAEAVGKYSTGCVMRAGPGSEYKEIIGTLTDSGGGVGKGVIQYKAYGQDASCSPASLNYDVTATVEVADSPPSKRRSMPVNWWPVEVVVTGPKALYQAGLPLSSKA